MRFLTDEALTAYGWEVIDQSMEGNVDPHAAVSECLGVLKDFGLDWKSYEDMETAESRGLDPLQVMAKWVGLSVMLKSMRGDE